MRPLIHSFPVRLSKIVIGCCIVVFLIVSSLVYFNDYSIRLEAESLTDYEEQVCHQPKLDINNTEVIRFLKDVPPLNCDDEKDWVEIDGSTVRITEDAKKKYGNIKCHFTADPAVIEMLRKRKEEESRKKRRDAAERFRREVKRACCYSIPWAVAVMEHSCAFLRNLPNVVMPTVELHNEDLVFRQTDQELINLHKLKDAARAKERSMVTVENVADTERGLRDPPAPSVDSRIHNQEPSWDEEVEAASRRHRQHSPAKSDASVQTVRENTAARSHGLTNDPLRRILNNEDIPNPENTEHLRDRRSERERRNDGPTWGDNRRQEPYFEDVVRSSDFGTFQGHVTTTHTEFDLEESDFFRVYCKTESGKIWENRMAGTRLDSDIMGRVGWEYLPKESLKLNVLIMGFDSLSRMTFMRKLPKAYKKLQSLGAIVLEGYNILGDGTPQALIPLLTGKTELELPDTRKRMGTKASHVNVYPFVWNDFRKFGYVTAFMEDCPNAGIFTYRLKGFHTQPTDHYMRTWYVDAVDTFSSQKPYCMGSKSRHEVMLDYARHIFTVYKSKPKFVFGFHGELSHDSYNLIGVADNDIVKWLDWFESNGHLNDTVLLFMSDHGHRFAEVRSTQQGKLEERLPFFSFTFPPWFKDKYAEAYNNFKENAHRLTTPFDINKTLRSILHFDGTGIGTLDERAISLFKKVPKQRSCGDAEIEPHWCACLMWQNLDIHSKHVHRAATEFVDFVNAYVSKHSNACHQLQLVDIFEAARLLPNKRVLSFKGSSDADGHIPDLSNKIKLTDEVIQVKVRTTPGDGIFEFSAIYHLNDDRFVFQVHDISRTNPYGVTSLCIENNQEDLRKYCYCKKQRN